MSSVSVLDTWSVKSAKTSPIVKGGETSLALYLAFAIISLMKPKKLWK